MGMGMVLYNEELMDKIGKDVAEETTRNNYNDTIKVLEEVIPLVGSIPEQRKKEMKLLNTGKEDTWDDGIVEWYNAVRM
eukprot:15048524-Ditylum_brightwellii.AAC.1